MGKLNVLKDRTYLNPNDDFFGGKIKVTTRADRQMKLERQRSRNSSTSSKKSKRRSSRVHRRQSSKSDRNKRMRSPKIYEEEKEEVLREPGNDHDDHPLNYDLDQKRRHSQKLSESASPKGYIHLNKKSLAALD